jgi:hypothetical protein
MSRLLAFTGPAGSGKSTAADALMEVGWVRVKFADPLKNMLRAFYQSCGLEHNPYIEARIEGNLKEEPDPFLRGRTPRHAMQTLGTEWGRDLISADVWVEAWKQKVMSLLDREIDVVCDDCRFPNEADAVRLLGGKIVGLKSRRGLGMKPHASEAGDIQPDMVYRNQRNLSGFTHDVVHIFHNTHYE